MIDKKSNKELQNKVLKAANLMRSAGLNTLQYIEQLTDLLYLKILDDMETQAEKERSEIIKDFGDSDVDEFYTVLNDDKYRFYNWAGTVVDKVTFLDELYEYLKKHPHNTIQQIFKRSYLLIRDNATLERVVQIIKDINLNDYNFDVKGQIYEYLLSRLGSDAGDLGQFFTPRHYSDLMTIILNPQIGEINYDPTSGTGGFLTRAFVKVKNDMDNLNILEDSKWDFLHNYQFIGGDISAVTTKLCMMNMMLHGCKNPTIKNEDSLSYQVNEALAGKVDGVLSNPPYGNTSIVTKDLFDFPIKSNSPENLFLQHIIHVLKDGGRACVVVPEGILFRNQDKKLREYLLTNCNLKMVISLPQGAFLPYTGVKTSIVYFEKGTPTKSVWFYNIKNDGFELNNSRNPIEKNDIPDLLEKMKNFEEGENSVSVSIESIKNAGYSLMVNKYKQSDLEYNSYDFIELKDLIDIKTGKKNANEKEEDGQYPFFTCSEESYAINSYAFDGEYVLLAGNGEFNVKYYNGKFDAYQRTYVIQSKDESVLLNKYLYYILKDKISYFKEISQGSVVKYIKLSDIQDLKIPVPDIDTQLSYINRLDNQHNLSNNIKQTLNDFYKNNIDKSLFAKYKNDFVKLGNEEYFKIVGGTTPSRQKSEYFGGDILWFTPTDVTNNNGLYIEDSKEKVTELGFQNSSLKIVPANSVMLSSRATIGEVAIPTKDFTTNQGFKVFICNDEKVLPEYLAVCLIAYKEDIKDLGTGTTFKEVTKSSLQGFSIPVPSLDEQKKIVNRYQIKLSSIKYLLEMQKEINSTMGDIISELFN